MVNINNIQKGFTVMDETRLDKIEIKELEVFANHGVYPEEMFWDRNLLFLPRFLPEHVWRD